MAEQGTAISEADWNAALAERDTPSTETAPTTEPPQTEQSAQPSTETTAQAATSQEAAPEAKPALDPEIQAKLAKFDEMAALFPQMVNELKATQGRVGKMQSDWDKARASAEQPSQTQIAAAAKDPEKWAELKKDFPEWGDAITEYVDSKLAALAGGKGPSAEEIEQLVAQRTTGAVTELERAFNEKLVTLRHPGWKDEVKTDAFKAWFDVQDEGTKRLAASTDGLDAVRMMDLYVESKKKPAASVKDERQARLAAAATPARPAQAGATTKSFDEMSPEEQWNYLARQRDQAAS